MQPQLPCKIAQAYRTGSARDRLLDVALELFATRGYHNKLIAAPLVKRWLAEKAGMVDSPLLSRFNFQAVRIAGMWSLQRLSDWQHWIPLRQIKVSLSCKTRSPAILKLPCLLRLSNWHRA
jgi:hypothetical protein